MSSSRCRGSSYFTYYGLVNGVIKIQVYHKPPKPPTMRLDLSSVVGNIHCSQTHKCHQQIMNKTRRSLGPPSAKQSSLQPQKPSASLQTPATSLTDSQHSCCARPARASRYVSVLSDTDEARRLKGIFKVKAKSDLDEFKTNSSTLPKVEGLHSKK